jgi:hypothetical protein
VLAGRLRASRSASARSRRPWREDLITGGVWHGCLSDGGASAAHLGQVACRRRQSRRSVNGEALVDEPDGHRALADG